MIYRFKCLKKTNYHCTKNTTCLKDQLMTRFSPVKSDLSKIKNRKDFNILAVNIDRRSRVFSSNASCNVINFSQQSYNIHHYNREQSTVKSDL